MKLFQKIKSGERRQIIILGFIKINYKKKTMPKNSIIFYNNGENNKVNGIEAGNACVYGTGCIAIKGDNNEINISANCTLMNISIKVNGNNNIINFHEDSILSRICVDIVGDNARFIIKKNCRIGYMEAVLGGAKDLVCTLEIGANLTTGKNLRIYCGSEANTDVYIGDDCMFSRDIVILAYDGHPIFDRKTDKRINYTNNSVKIGNHVWLGQDVQINKEVTIPNNTIVGARSLVTKSFTEEYTVIAGNPAKVIKKDVYFKNNLEWN